jgi:chromate reductase
MSKFKLGLIVGSNRRQSINRQLAQALGLLGADSFEAKFIQIDDLPMYNQDLELPVPEKVARFKSELEAADAILFVTPEHSRSIPAVLKNAIDWGTRPWGKNSWTGKTAAVTGTSQGAVATAVAQQHLRAVLGDIGMVVMGGEAYISFKPGLVDERHAISDPSVRAFLKAFLDQLAALAAKLTAKVAPRAAA